MQKKRLKRLKVAALSGAVLGVGISFYFLGATFFKESASCLLYPFLRLQHAVVSPVKHWAQSRRSYNALVDEVAQLTKEREALQRDLSAARGSLKYCNDIKELSAFAQRYEDQHAALAQVIFRQCNEHEQFILVDKGSRHGIKPDMVAVVKNTLVGKVTLVYPYYSRVQLVTDKRCNVAVYCAKTHATGVHEGCNNADETSVCYVSHLAKVKEGDWVLSSGEGIIFPQGFVLGSIERAKKESLYYAITVKPFVNAQTLSYCYLLHKDATG